MRRLVILAAMTLGLVYAQSSVSVPGTPVPPTSSATPTIDQFMGSYTAERVGARGYEAALDALEAGYYPLDEQGIPRDPMSLLDAADATAVLVNALGSHLIGSYPAQPLEAVQLLLPAMAPGTPLTPELLLVALQNLSTAAGIAIDTRFVEVLFEGQDVIRTVDLLVALDLTGSLAH